MYIVDLVHDGDHIRYFVHFHMEDHEGFKCVMLLFDDNRKLVEIIEDDIDVMLPVPS